MHHEFGVFFDNFTEKIGDLVAPEHVFSFIVFQQPYHKFLNESFLDADNHFGASDDDLLEKRRKFFADHEDAGGEMGHVHPHLLLFFVVVVDDGLEGLEDGLLVHRLHRVEGQEGVDAIGKGKVAEELDVSTDDYGRKE